MATRSIHLLIIDPQNDFCDLPPAYCAPGSAPSLPVSGAHADMQRVAALIDQCKANIDAITITLDSHQHIDIAHPTFWISGDGATVNPFTQITAADVRNGLYRPRQVDAQQRALAYLDALEAEGRYVHMVWPVHCEIGSWGHNVHTTVRAAYNRWEEQHLGCVDKVVKGTNPWTEHYSAIQAEVPVADDASTQVNAAFIARLRQADQVWITGEAGSHCVKATTEHIVEQLAADEIGKLVLLTDCMSPVAGFETQYHAFIDDMQRRGVQISTSAAIIAELVPVNVQE